jgi:hypothetical protein
MAATATCVQVGTKGKQEPEVGKHRPPGKRKELSAVKPQQAGQDICDPVSTIRPIVIRNNAIKFDRAARLFHLPFKKFEES